MSCQKPIISLYYDILSPYSWIAFESLLRYENHLAASLELLPVSIGFVFRATGNKPLAFQLPQKAAHMYKDLELVSRYWDIPLRPPKDFEGSVVKRANLIPQRFLTALSLHSPAAHLMGASRELWMRAWSRDESVFDWDSISQLCAKLGIPQSEQLIQSCDTDEVKETLRRRTDNVLAKGAFGLPWLVLSREGQQDVSLFGSDRLPILCDLLGKPFVGPMREGNRSGKL